MKIANQSGISVCLVMKPSKKPAMTKKGMVLTTIFSPFTTPILKDSILG